MDWGLHCSSTFCVLLACLLYVLSLLIVGKAFNIVNVLSVQVSKLADVMVRHGVKKGDRVVIYMPMIPQTVCCMLACARIGAIHSLIFGGFASKELSVRIDHAKVIHTWNNKCHCISYSCKPMSKTFIFSRKGNNFVWHNSFNLSTVPNIEMWTQYCFCAVIFLLQQTLKYSFWFLTEIMTV